ncbi:MAG: hypothetical protein JO110_15460 [Acetobacteraceae bacterium]|nr:hypothetical protein [Acetobacteraceae bacterium]
MRHSAVLIASLLGLALTAGAHPVSARPASAYHSGVSISTAPPVIDTGSEAYPSSPTGAGEHRASVTAAPPAIDTGSETYPSSATGAGERTNPVVAGGPMVLLSNGQSMPESVNSFPPGFTDPYLAHH